MSSSHSGASFGEFSGQTDITTKSCTKILTTPSKFSNQKFSRNSENFVCKIFQVGGSSFFEHVRRHKKMHDFSCKILFPSLGDQNLLFWSAGPRKYGSRPIHGIGLASRWQVPPGGPRGPRPPGIMGRKGGCQGCSGRQRCTVSAVCTVDDKP